MLCKDNKFDVRACFSTVQLVLFFFFFFSGFCLKEIIVGFYCVWEVCDCFNEEI